jgi:hypothetical protein
MKYRVQLLAFFAATGLASLHAQPASSSSAMLDRVEKLDAVQKNLSKAAKPEERLDQIRKLGDAFPELKKLTLDEAQSLSLSLSNPKLDARESQLIVQPYTELTKNRDWTSSRPEEGPFSPRGSALQTRPLGQAAPAVSIQDFSTLLEKVVELGKKLDAMNGRIAELEAKLKASGK